MSISQVSTASRIPDVDPRTAPPPKAAPIAKPPTAGPKPAPAASGQQKAALSQLLAKYSNEQSHGATASALSSLGRQIMAEAKALGQNVRLPSGSSNAAPSPTPAAGGGGRAGRVNLTA